QALKCLDYTKQVDAIKIASLPIHERIATAPPSLTPSGRKNRTGAYSTRTIPRPRPIRTVRPRIQPINPLSRCASSLVASSRRGNKRLGEVQSNEMKDRELCMFTSYMFVASRTAPVE
ncbi:hypothetical protein Hypma_010774, partial [Hypsizygus marmoreus]